MLFIPLSQHITVPSSPFPSGPLMVPRGFQRLAGQMPDALHVTNRGQCLLAGSPLVPSPFLTRFFLHPAAAIASLPGLR